MFLWWKKYINYIILVAYIEVMNRLHVNKIILLYKIYVIFHKTWFCQSSSFSCLILLQA